MNRSTRRGAAVAAALTCICFNQTAWAQSAFDFSGRLYADYSYVFNSPVSEEEGDNAFGYRRVYFTANYRNSDRFSGRLRLEANDKSTTAQGKPAPYVKDLYLKWKGALGEGHDIVMGVSSPPSWEVAEKLWGYRSLQKTIQDRAKILSSRDMGLAVKGRLVQSGKVRYGVMVANNESVSRETDKHKRLYGQIEIYPGEHVFFTVGSDYASYADGSAFNFNAFGGYSSEDFRAGIEAFLNPRTIDGSSDDWIRSGATVFVVARLAKSISGVGRFDVIGNDFVGERTTETLFIGGVSFDAGPGVQIIPNVVVNGDSEESDAHITGRVTLNVDIG